MSFEQLVSDLKRFQLKCAPYREAEIEAGLAKYLVNKHYPVRRQVVYSEGRFDIVVGKFIIETKRVGQKSIAEQLDRYSGHCEGLILVCWRASRSVRQLFAVAKKQAKIPIELVEITKSYEL